MRTPPHASSGQRENDQLIRNKRYRQRIQTEIQPAIYGSVFGTTSFT